MTDDTRTKRDQIAALRNESRNGMGYKHAIDDVLSILDDPPAQPVAVDHPVEGVSHEDASVPDHCAWAMRGYWKNAYEALLSDVRQDRGNAK